MHMPSYVLLAEDERFLRELISLELRERGFLVEEVSDGREAINAIKREAPSALLLDLSMPKADGFAVLEFLRDANVPVPVIILTNSDDPPQRERCFVLGATAFFVKSDLHWDDLVREIHRQAITADVSRRSA